MKKITIILLAMLLVASIGQAASAKGSVGAFAGYNYFREGLSAVVNGEYEFVNWFSLVGEAGFNFINIFNKDESNRVEYSISLTGKFNFLSIEKFNLGAELFVGLVNISDLEVIVVPGIYANIVVFEKLKLALELGAAVYSSDAGFGFMPKIAFFEASYMLSDSISIGIGIGVKIPFGGIGMSVDYKF